MKNRFAQRLWQLAPWLWMAAGYVYMLWYHIVPGAWMIDSDMAGEMVLADLLNQEGGFLSTNWYYTTELHVFQMQWLFRVGLRIFPQDWHAARVFSMAVALALLVAAFLFFARCAGLGRLGIWAAAALIWPFGFWYLFTVLYGSFYLSFLYFSLFTFGIVLRLCRGGLPRQRAAVWLAAGMLLGVMSGLNGIRQLMVLYAPLAAAAAVVAAVRLRARRAATLREALQACPECKALLGVPVLFSLCSGFGYLLNIGLLAKNHHYQSFNDLVWQSGGERRLSDVWREFLLQFGYHEKPPLFSFAGIASGCGLLLGLVVLFCLIRLCLRFGHLELSQQMVVAYMACALFICGLVFCYLGVYEPNYWMPLIPFALFLLPIEAETDTVYRATPHCLAVVFALMITVCSVGTVRSELAEPLRARPGLVPVVHWLVDNGYKMGYAFFWDSQVVTELSSGEIEMCTIKEDFSGITPWLQRADHEWRQPTMPCFTLLRAGSDPGPMAFNARLVYEDANYDVYAYDDPATVPDILSWGS